MAYLSINKLHVELERQKGGWNYRVLDICRPATFIAAILVGNTTLVLYGNYMHQFMELILSSGLIGHLVRRGNLHFNHHDPVFAEFLPKTVFRQNAEGLMKVLSVPAAQFSALRAPSALL